MILGQIHFSAQGLLVDTPGGASSVPYGYGFYLGGNADAKLDSVFVTKASAAGLLANQQASVSATHSTFSGSVTGSFYLDQKMETAGDGFVAADQAIVTLDQVRVEGCAQVGMLFDGVKGSVTRSVSTRNQVGLVLEDITALTVDSVSSFAGNTQEGRTQTGDFSVPTTPAAVPP
jgi:hypothetical protein